MNNQAGLCQCGCGQKTKTAKKNDKRHGHIAGCPIRFINGHNSKGKGNPSWNGGRHIDTFGYVRVYCSDHPKKHRSSMNEARLIAERVLGKYLPDKAIIHHNDGNKINNSHCNLVICESVSYHMLIHQRIRAHKACGHASWRKCQFCKKYDAPNKLYISPNGRSKYHVHCAVEYNRKRLFRHKGKRTNLKED
ncbi:MAG: HNH endonuclease [Candidatus Micrarchaeia archaeon]